MWVDAEVKAADHAPAIAVADACEPAVGPAHEGVQVILGQLLTAVELGPDETVELAERRRIAGRAARVALRVLRVFRLSAIVEVGRGAAARIGFVGHENGGGVWGEDGGSAV